AELEPILGAVLDATATWTPWNEARRAAARGGASAAMEGEGGGAPGDLDELLLTLIDAGLLCHDLAPPLVGRPSGAWMCARLTGTAAGESLRRACAHLGAGDLAGGREALGGLPGAQSGRADVHGVLLQGIRGPATLARAPLERAARLAPLLFRLQEALLPP